MFEPRRDNTPPKPGPKHEVKRLKANEKIVCTILDDEVQGYWIHWTDRHSIPCNSRREECEGCNLEMPTKWRGYLSVLDHRDMERKLIELTACAAESMQLQLGTTRDWRGWNCELTRGNGDKARLTVRGGTRCNETTLSTLPIGLDSLGILTDLWRRARQKYSK
jgi:hypothetical protein